MSNVNAVAEIGIAGEFDLLIQKCLTDADGVAILDDAGNPITVGAPRHVLSQKNLITNTGMDLFGTEAGFSGTIGFGQYCRVGSGSAEPAFTNTSLVAQVASVVGPSATTAWGTGDYLNAVLLSRTYTFGVGVAAGNLTEIGLSNGASGNLLTRSLFKDAGGTPITIVVAADEQLIVNYRIIFRADTADKVFNPPPTSPTPTSYTLTLRPAGLGSSGVGVGQILGAGLAGANQRVYYGPNSEIGPITGYPAGATYGNHTATTSAGAYTPGSFQRTDTYTINTASANYADIGVIMFNGGMPFEWQLGISPRLTKVAPETIKITILNKWARD